MQPVVTIITPETSADDVIALSMLSGPSDEKYYEKIMRGFIANTLSDAPDLSLGIVYGLYDGPTLLGSARIKQDEYTYTAVSIEYVAIRPDHRGRGLGTLLMQGLFREIKDRWKKKIAILATSQSKGFYERIGMSQMGTINGPDGFYRYYMYKWLE